MEPRYLGCYRYLIRERKLLVEMGVSSVEMGGEKVKFWLLKGRLLQAISSESTGDERVHG